MVFAKYYWLDKSVTEDLKSLILKLTDKYKIPFDDVDYFVNHLQMEYIEDSKENDFSNQYRKADMLLKFCKLKGDAVIKTPRSTLKVDGEFLKLLQESVVEEREEILNSGVLIGYSEEEKHTRIEALAEKEKQEEEKLFKTKIYGTVCFLREVKAFSNNLTQNEAAFLYDLFYHLQNNFEADLRLKWKDTPYVQDDKTKKKIIERYITEGNVID